MPQGRYARVLDESSGLIFVFAYDRTDPDLLHIFARHTTSIDEAIGTFFADDADTAWNEQRARFESYSESHGLFWFWLEEDRTVMVISCFRL